MFVVVIEIDLKLMKQHIFNQEMHKFIVYSTYIITCTFVNKEYTKLQYLLSALPR